MNLYPMREGLRHCRNVLNLPNGRIRARFAAAARFTIIGALLVFAVLLSGQVMCFWSERFFECNCTDSPPCYLLNCFMGSFIVAFTCATPVVVIKLILISCAQPLLEDWRADRQQHDADVEAGESE